MAIPELTRTPEGWELQFATNHLGHFALALGLHDALAAAGDARIVVGQLQRATCARRSSSTTSTSSSATYEPWSAYGQSKTANVLFAVEATRALGRRRHHRQRPDAGRHRDQPAAPRRRRRRGPTGRGRRQPAAICSSRRRSRAPRRRSCSPTSPLLEGVGGRYFEDCNEARTVPADNAAADGVREYALDPHAARRLWEESLAMLEAPISVSV